MPGHSLLPRFRADTVLCIRCGLRGPCRHGAETPPDVISQGLLAVPMWLLFELGVFFSGWFVRQTEAAAAASDQGNGYHPLSEAEMDAELDGIEAEEKKQQ